MNTNKLFAMIFSYEAGELSHPQVLELFSELVSTGLAWDLQGTYARTAMHLISAGYLSEEGTILSTDPQKV